MQWVETGDTVRFNEVDEWGIVWYGHYMAWFEIGRMSLLKKFDLLPRQLVEMGYVAPVVNLACRYHHSALCGDEIIIRSTVTKPEIAALTFRFEILSQESRQLLAEGETTQVILTTDKTMIYRLSGELETRVTRMVNYCMGS